MFFWLISLVSTLVIAVPIAVIFRRAGMSMWWTLFVLVPFGLFICLAILAFRDWPAEGAAYY